MALLLPVIFRSFVGANKFFEAFAISLTVFQVLYKKLCPVCYLVASKLPFHRNLFAARAIFIVGKLMTLKMASLQLA